MLEWVRFGNSGQDAAFDGTNTAGEPPRNSPDLLRDTSIAHLPYEQREHEVKVSSGNFDPYIYVRNVVTGVYGLMRRAVNGHLG